MTLRPRSHRSLAPRILRPLAGLVLLLIAVPAHAQCPASSLTFPSIPEFPLTGAQFDSTSTDGSIIRGDLSAGVLFIHHSGSLAPTVFVARDLFDLSGVPPGTIVPVTVHLDIAGFAYTYGCSGSGCCGRLIATIRDGTASSEGIFQGHAWLGRGDFSGRVDLPVTLVAGTPHALEFELWSRRCPGGSHTVDAEGRVSFEGTNPDAFVVSCEGFGPKVVPVEKPSWGRLKLLYR